MDQCPFRIAFDPDGDRFHLALTVRVAVAAVFVHVLAPQAGRAVVPVAGAHGNVGNHLFAVHTAKAVRRAALLRAVANASIVGMSGS